MEPPNVLFVFASLCISEHSYTKLIMTSTFTKLTGCHTCSLIRKRCAANVFLSASKDAKLKLKQQEYNQGELLQKNINSSDLTRLIKKLALHASRRLFLMQLHK